ncbi:TBC domain-containing protein C215.01-like isoform X2 [Neltuma alba]|uniref:TBC domain-containing protein C215.01-like isoform X2 n=1 Tax=Neltuma alba TaxID=207710 RepID=UPI0010A3D188|nr:TBC domain-containing protein C215.01-like isoform X2 [Prosopis alba]XP_028775122.1 TBC domain-containing protein C215.01-like isoform X2 [Prosopis alba]
MLLSLLSKRSLEIDSRDSYGFALRPQHAQTYREYASIYKVEEDERCDKWRNFFEQISKSSQPYSLETGGEKGTERISEGNDFRGKESAEGNERKEHLYVGGTSKEGGSDYGNSDEETEPKEETSLERLGDEDDSSVTGSTSDNVVHLSEERKTVKLGICAEIRPSLIDIEKIMSSRIRKGKIVKGQQIKGNDNHLPSMQQSESVKGASERTCEDDVCVNETLDNNTNASRNDNAFVDRDSSELFFAWKELQFLVQGGVPKDIRGEVWQAFVGVKTRRVESYYENLLAEEIHGGESKERDDLSGAFGKWRKQIEKDVPRTFPGHPALDENGRNSLRRLLLAYARHNPSVGYCQAMNFFAGLLLLFMPEENAFWALVGIIDDYFEGCYTEEMIESQVDQLVFEELVRERFPKLVKHLDYLGVQVTWISGPWFLSIFVNTLPWESVLRVWDVLLFEGNRVMLFRTALALMELYGSSLVTTKDAGDALTLLQSLTGSTFDSSQLVFTACMGFLAVTEARLQELRDKHRSSVLVVLEERSKKGCISKDSKGVAAKLSSFKREPGSLAEERKTADEEKSYLEPQSSNLDEFLNGLHGSQEDDSLPDLQEQVVWLKAELCRLSEEKRASVLRSEELETALMEAVKQDNRLALIAKVYLIFG